MLIDPRLTPEWKLCADLRLSQNIDPCLGRSGQPSMLMPTGLQGKCVCADIAQPSCLALSVVRCSADSAAVGLSAWDRRMRWASAAWTWPRLLIFDLVTAVLPGRLLRLGESSSLRLVFLHGALTTTVLVTADTLGGGAIFLAVTALGVTLNRLG